MEKLGIEGLVAVAMLGAEVGNVAGLMVKTEGAAKYAHLLKLTDEVSAVMKVTLDQVKKEYADLDDVERAQLMLAVKTKFDLENDLLEKAVEDLLELGVEGISYVGKCKDTYERLQGALKA